jgi:transposase
VFAIHGVNAAGQIELQRPVVRRDKLEDLIAALPPCLIGMEACSGAHDWARRFARYGHTIKLIAPKFVAPYRLSGKRGKNDAADAAAICEAVSRPAMRFVPVKTVEQQGELSLHRTRQGYVEQRTALINRVRGLLAEFGIVLAQKAETVRREVALLLEDLPGHANTVMGDALTDLERLDARITEYDRHIAACAKANPAAKQLMQLSGIGPTTASALVASIGDGHDFKNGRQLAAWLGLVPGQYSSGGKQRLGRITKAGDRYLRTLLILGARSVLQSGKKKDDPISRWTQSVEGRRGYWWSNCATRRSSKRRSPRRSGWKAVVAMAAKNARLAWAVLRHGENFKLYGEVASAGAA